MQNVIQWHQKWLFFQKIIKNYKKFSSGWGLSPQAPIASGTWRLCSLGSLFSKVLVKCQTQGLIIHSAIFLSYKSSLLQIYDDVIACDLWFRPLSPLIKNPSYVCRVICWLKMHFKYSSRKDILILGTCVITIHATTKQNKNC